MIKSIIMILLGVCLLLLALWGGTFIYIHLKEDYHIASAFTAIIIGSLGFICLWTGLWEFSENIHKDK